MSNEPAPAHLAATGQNLWGEVVKTYDLRVDELATLEDVCSITDMIVMLEKAWADDGKPMVAKGSTGQLVIHPLIGEIRTQKAARNALWRQLKLPDDPGGEKPNQQRQAAQSRWSQAHGTGA